ncbi:PglZ domain-containing protein [Bifidobacterium margollesii]|uniref:PglZ domain-containing protein n=1 Tax=Bifidobacterium margollesii TaxID=2020964 RepID=A0A2N5J7Q3_9BIFI|nr:BREX-1 system phosphatase PglZ type A [Bifidobacterium margollesii]PLS30248.1 PglZ domain-containing protein [Bifidobacterium margollesii]
MSGNTQIARLLAARYAKFDGTPHGEGRVVFWHDETGEFSDEIDTIVGPEAENDELRDVEPVRLERNPFALKYRILLAEPKTKFLVYLKGKLPADADNWLLDLEIAYGPLFTADKLSMILNELFPREASAETRDAWLAVMQRTKPFFDDDDLVAALQRRLRADDDARTFQAKMIASLLGLPDGEHSLQAIWRELLIQYSKDSTQGIDDITGMGLADYHWANTRGIYRFDSDGQLSRPTVKDFVIWLFRLAWNGFSDSINSVDHYANIRRDFDTWRNDPKTTDVIKALADEVFPDLSLDSVIADMSLTELERHDVFSEVEERIVELLYEALDDATVTDDEVQRIIASRRYGLWFPKFDKDYAIIASASELHAILRQCRPVMESITSAKSGFEAYTASLYQVDGCYRRFVAAWKAGSRLMGRTIAENLEREYSRYQSDLGMIWQRQVDDMDDWEIPDVHAQTEFYKRNVEPMTNARKKIAVIISDALRYEVAEELCRKLNEQSRWTATMASQLSTLPSYTQLGMAALLPHTSLSLSTTDHYHALVDGNNAGGMAARSAILAEVNGKAVKADDLLDMKRDEYRELMKSCSVLYVYHDDIDVTGDNERSEEDVFDACTRTLNKLDAVVKRLANANVTNMIVTADHGFLYQDHDVSDAEWLSERPSGDAIWQEKRRFVIGANLVGKPAFTTFTAAQVGLRDPADEGVTIQVPNAIHRLRIKGPGVRYVHGGASLPEIVVPIVRINRGRSASEDVRKVNFRIQQTTDRITTGQITVDFLQTEPVGGKVCERTILAGLWGKTADGESTLISNEVPIAFGSTSTDAADRHVPATFLLAGDADRFNNTVIELRLSERIDGSNQMRQLDAKAEYLLKRGLFADDGFDF